MRSRPALIFTQAASHFVSRLMSLLAIREGGIHLEPSAQDGQPMNLPWKFALGLPVLFWVGPPEASDRASHQMDAEEVSVAFPRFRRDLLTDVLSCSTHASLIHQGLHDSPAS